ncbi:M56 family metallopeptidase [Arenibacter latericius]|uniref:M56 family metallopeptidase n=1 Tax=Arenibacter latericius TaxID=86104 RepID=UPI00041F9BDC|nr:M56 family metallopeptidase [Arenibacter latericius]
MWMYLLKFSACLLALLLFYKVVLEKVHIHHFKRYYLLAAFIIALGIPLITFTQYVTVVVQPLPQPLVIEANLHQQAPSPVPSNLLPLLLWGLYGLGVAVFTIKFLLNLKSIISSIRNNPKQRSGKLQHVLVKEQIAPHTFFSYLFFNLKNYRTYKIPQEVFWHEETHARQKHSMDILLLELLQIVFWFHPLIYWAKHLVKLNHEFLADQAVLKKGAAVPAYQNLVLAFSSNAIAPKLANAIHYSSIKKRIVIMKTQTSQRAIWLKSLLLLPLMVLLLYSFSTKEILEIKKVEKETILPDHLKEKKTGHEIFYDSNIQVIPEHEILISINKYGQLLVEDNFVEINDLKSHLLNYNQGLSKEQKSQLVKAIIRVDKETPDNIIKKTEAILMDYGVATIDIKEGINPQDQEGASTKKIRRFNTLAKKVNESLPEAAPNKINLLINKKSQFLINGDLITIDKLPAAIQELQKEYKLNREEISFVSLTADLLTPKKTVSEVIEIIEEQGLTVIVTSHQVPQMDTLYTYNRLAQRIKTIPENRTANLIYLKDIYAKMNTSQKSKVQHPDRITENTHPQDGATKTEIEEYNKLAKQYNAQPINDRIVKKKDLERLEYIYNRMSDAQKKNALPFPECPPPPTPSAPKSSKVEKGTKVPPPPPPAPAPRVKKGGKDNFPPPPPPLNNPNQGNYSDELLTSYKKFNNKADAYAQAIVAYNRKGEGTLLKLHNLLEEILVLHDSYMELARKEGLMSPTKATPKDNE